MLCSFGCRLLAPPQARPLARAIVSICPLVRGMRSKPHWNMALQLAWGKQQISASDEIIPAQRSVHLVGFLARLSSSIKTTTFEELLDILTYCMRKQPVAMYLQRRCLLSAAADCLPYPTPPTTSLYDTTPPSHRVLNARIGGRVRGRERQRPGTTEDSPLV